MKYKHYIIKRQVEDIFIAPFICIGRIIAWLFPLKTVYETFFLFPFYHTGGAEKVHALITQATGNSNCIIYFTRKSCDETFYRDFNISGCAIKDISKYTDNKWLYFLNLIYRGILSGHINNQREKAIVFNGQCNFGYKLSPWVSDTVSQVELIHSFNTFSWIRLPFLPFIKETIMISRVRMEDHIHQYKNLQVPVMFANKIKHIVNGIPLPARVSPKDFDGRLQVLYVGRGTPEKRVHLVAQIAAASNAINLPADFIFLGDVATAIPEAYLPYCILLGQSSDAKLIETTYAAAHVIIITSATEGFPMVIEEAMARGCSVLATAVGDIPIHITTHQNGLLFTSVTDEETIVKEGCAFVKLLCEDKELLQQMSERNVQYAKANFGLEYFNQQYRQFFNQLRKEA